MNMAETEFTKDVLKQLASGDRSDISAISWLRLKLKSACKIIDGQDEENVQLRRLVGKAVFLEYLREGTMCVQAKHEPTEFTEEIRNRVFSDGFDKANMSGDKIRLLATCDEIDRLTTQRDYKDTAIKRLRKKQKNQAKEINRQAAENVKLKEKADALDEFMASDWGTLIRKVAESINDAKENGKWKEAPKKGFGTLIKKITNALKGE